MNDVSAPLRTGDIKASDHWTTTDTEGSGLIVYIFRVGAPRLVILRLVY